MVRNGVLLVGVGLALAGCGSTTIVTVTKPELGDSTQTQAAAGTTSTGTVTRTVGSTTSSAASTTGATGATASTVTTANPATGPGAATSTAATSVHSTGVRSAARLITFESPSRNLGCVIADGTVRCDIKQRDWSPPPHPASCSKEVDFGQGLIVSRSGSGGFVCAGDTALDPSARTLAYGRQTTADGFTCTSAETGMTCRSDSSGHGFFISIQSYRTF